MKSAAIIRSREVAANLGFLSTVLNGNAVGTKVSRRYRQCGRSSEVVVRGVPLYILTWIVTVSHTFLINNKTGTFPADLLVIITPDAMMDELKTQRFYIV